MGVGSLIKQPAESRLYTMEFAANLAEDETLSSVSSCTAAPDGLTIAAAAVSGTRATARISGGTAPTTYKVTFVVVTSAGNTLEGEGNLIVRQL